MLGASIPLSSGDFSLDRRVDWARSLIARGDVEAAAELLRDTIDSAPGFLAAWFLYGETQERLRIRDEAIGAYRRVITLDPEDKLGASLRLARLEKRRPDAMPPAYVRTLFDQNAARFENDLLRTLSYRGPELLRSAIERTMKARRQTPHFIRVLDLGCGTGLMGSAIRDLAEELVGVDLSPAMIAGAQNKGVYDRLVVRDLLAFLESEPEPFDLIVAADVFVYLDDLRPVLIAAAQKLVSGGLLAFSVETHPGNGVILHQGLRFSHGRRHLRAAAKAAKLELGLLERAATRTENRKPVQGLIAVLAAPRAQSRRNTRLANRPVRTASSAVPRP